MMNVTILTDGNGVKREYREVKREGNVGELVKADKKSSPFFQKGDIGKFVGGYHNVDFSGQGNVKVGEHDLYRVSSYVVLEPTDIIHVDGVRYREEKREAKAGERILIVAAESADRMYDNGSVRTVKEIPEQFNCVIVNEHSRIIYHREYVVITPLDEPATNNITVNLTVNVTSSSPTEILKAIVDSVQAELAKFVGAPNNEETRDKITEVLTNKSRDGIVEQASKGAVSGALQKIRDNTVERAKADLVELRSDMSDVLNPALRGRADIYLLKGHLGLTADFIVNKEKRTVACLLRGGVPPERVFARGTAKCSPDDCFNVHIGKAIALRRALGLDVPTDYLNAPHPTEPRVGDVVKAIDGIHGGISGLVESVGDTSFINGANGLVFRNTEYEKLKGYSRCWTYLKNVKIIDDSNPQSAYVSEVYAVA
ncbi:hypothetical protein P4V86_15380 [Brevibacillus laterosporus]|uniref:hypothetical protein n=1 Tax=Brevibacillus laterosporus TaxID=1465 RepID=UPI000363302F|nr:hypothetical protein [Brevibacillus laterosporus]ATO51011.1 hypothetical protein BrL25_19070 [Brevibacillus laterosporus DSM 25]MED2004727.1 hypothetical protein [Brevibacillus laterosporus]